MTAASATTNPPSSPPGATPTAVETGRPTLSADGVLGSLPASWRNQPREGPTVGKAADGFAARSWVVTYGKPAAGGLVVTVAFIADPTGLIDAQVAGWSGVNAYGPVRCGVSTASPGLTSCVRPLRDGAVTLAGDAAARDLAALTDKAAWGVLS